MIVHKLKATNVKKIKSAEITPNSNLVLISGRNGQGKSSLIDCLVWALAGKREIPQKPIRQGEEKAEIVLDLGDMIVTRTFTPKDTYLKVTTKDGAEYPSAQARLDKITDMIYLDPLKFVSLSSDHQKKILLEALGVDISLEETAYKETYQERTIAGRVYRDASTALTSTSAGVDLEFANRAKVDVMALVQKNRELDLDIDSINALDQAVAQYKETVEDLEARLAEAKKSLAHGKTQLADHVKRHGNPAEIEIKITQNNEIIKSAETTNSNIDAANRFVADKARVDDLKVKYDTLESELAAIALRIEDKLKTAKSPIDGLKVNDTGIELNGIPFGQLSHSEQLKTSLAIAMSKDQELKLIRIEDGSLLDTESLKVVEDMANAKGYQVWVEIVDETGGVGFYVEDGEVKA